MSERTGLEIAVIGLAGRFPEAADIDEYWKRLCASEECIRDLSDEELLAQGVPQEMIDDPSYVRRVGVVDGEDLFDAGFFDLNPREAEVIDPQQRLFLECAWHALEDAGYTPHGKPIGVYAGSGANYYSTNNLMSRPDYLQLVDPFQVKIGMDPDFLATRVAYKLNLLGPALTVQTACSTSLVAIHMACQGLLSGACDMALAGGVAIRVPQRVGSQYKEGGIVSPDGHCRAFDAEARGTIGGNGAGLVVLKRLEEALEDGDYIYAVVRGSAINNDGSRKVGYTAPSIEGQARAIRAAQLMAEVDPRTIGYVEAHGTGTSLGDPIEIAALTKAFREGTQDNGFCRIGSVKTTIGHLDTAAGVAGFIKAVLSLEREKIPASLNFEKPNPSIDFENSPFRVNAELRDWKRQSGQPRRAAVSSFGIGGTNAHAVLEEAPERAAPGPGRDRQLLLVSARSENALAATAAGLAHHLEEHPDLDLADVAYTLQVGRTTFDHRLAVVAGDTGEATRLLSGEEAEGRWRGQANAEREPVFLFPGQGAQYPGMGRGLYASEEVFRQRVDRCAEILEPHLGRDLRDLLFPEPGGEEESAQALQRTELTQPALFTIEYALAGLWEQWGLLPSAMIGHSIGEYVAACLAGVFTLDDALALVAARGRLMGEMPTGSMLSIPLSEEELEGELDGGLALAAVNAPGLCVVSGPDDEIDALAARLEERGVGTTRLHTSHAFHSSMMDPAREAFLKEVGKVELGTPRIPFVSNLTGTWIRDDEARSPEYWADHLRSAVRFANGAAALLEEPARIYVEVGPGKTLTTFLRRTAAGRKVDVHPSLRHPKDDVGDLDLVLSSLGKLWLAGAPVDGRGVYHGQRRQRLPLPGYAFERRRYWVEPGKEKGSLNALDAGPAQPQEEEGRIAEVEHWFHVPVWRPVMAPDLETGSPKEWLLFADGLGVAEALAARLRGRGHRVALVEPGEDFQRLDDDRFTVAPADAASHRQLLEALAEEDRRPGRLVHLWTLDHADEESPRRAEELGLLGLVALGRALGSHDGAVDLAVVSNRLFNVSGSDPVVAEKALLEGPCRVMPQELPGVSCRLVDVQPVPVRGDALERLLEELLSSGDDLGDEPVVALRGAYRWHRAFERRVPRLPETGNAPMDGLRTGGVYLVTGGLGGIGLATAEVLAERRQARLVFLGRSPFPAPEEWDDWLDGHPEDDPTSVRIRRLRGLEEQGGEVLVLQGDVCDRERMQRVLDEVREHFGALHGVVHAAGVPGGGLLRNKEADEVRRVLAPKVQGTRILASLVDGAPDVELMVLASSLASTLGGIGQVDYVAANAYLDAFAQERAGLGDLRVVSIDWDTWSESGMAVAAARGTDLDRLARRVDHPLVDRCLVETPERRVYGTDFGSESHWVLGEHRIEGVSLLPGTAYLELAAAVFADTTGTRSLELEDVVFLNPFFAPDEGTREVRTFLVKEGEGWRFSVASSQGRDAAGQEHWAEFSRGGVRELTDAAPAAGDLEAIRARLDEVEETLDTEQVRHGRHWHCLRSVRRGDGEMLASLRLPADLAGETADYALHPSLMDAATSFFAGAGAVLYLPVAYESLRVHRPLPADFFSHVRLRSGQQEGDERLLYDIDLLDGDGNVLVAVEGYTLQRVEDTAMRMQEGRQALEAQQGAPDREQEQEASLAALSDGITDAEGKDAVYRLLVAAPGPQVLVSTVPLAPRIARYRTTSLDQLMASQSISIPMERHPRPELSTEYLEPRDEREEAIAEVWGELLGLEKVGVHDDFFELGGHSLLGIQVNARLRDLYDVELSPGVIFEKPTVALLASSLEGEGAEQESILAEIQADGEDPAAALGLQVDDLSDNEVDSMLAELLEDGADLEEALSGDRSES